MMERSKYLEKPLNEMELIFAQNPKNLEKFYDYMKSRRLDESEWFDILILSYIKAIKKYCNIPGLHKYEFGAILFRTLDNGRINYFRDENRSKRKPNGAIISLDMENADENNKGTFIAEFIADKKKTAEENLIENDRVMEIISILDEEQKLIVSLLVDGYSQTEISKTMSVSVTTVWKKVECIRKSVTERLMEIGA